MESTRHFMHLVNKAESTSYLESATDASLCSLISDLRNIPDSPLSDYELFLKKNHAIGCVRSELLSRISQRHISSSSPIKEAGNRGEEDVLFRLRHLDPNEYIILNEHPLKLYSEELNLSHEYDFLVLNVKKRLLFNIEVKNYKGCISEKHGVWKHDANLIRPMFEQLDWQYCLLANLLRNYKLSVCNVLCFTNWGCKLRISDRKYAALRISDLLSYITNTHNLVHPEIQMTQDEISCIKKIISDNTVDETAFTADDLEFYLN